MMMIIDPFRLYRRRRRLAREAFEEAQFLKRRHGEAALAVAQAQLKRADLTSWGRQVMERVVRTLGREA